MWNHIILTLKGRSNRRRRSRRCGLGEPAGVELLDRRVLPSVTATFSVMRGVLSIQGDAHNNNITVSRNAGGKILVNGGAVKIRGGRATVGNTTLIQEFGLGGNDKLSLNEAKGALPKANISGGDGDDTITGGSRNDTLNGGAGNDTLIGGGGADQLFGGDGDDVIEGDSGNDVASMGAGNDRFVRNPGDGSDTVDGESGLDTMVFNGSGGNEKINVSASGPQVRFSRDVGNVNMALHGVEDIQFNSSGGADTITVNDLTGTDVTRLDLNLAHPVGNGAPASQASGVVVNGTNDDDSITITGDAGGVAVTGLFAQVNISGAQSSDDELTVNGLGGNDEVDASGLAAGAVSFVADGGDGDDVLIGSAGSDRLIGGAGENTLFGGPGLDVIDPGSADSVVIQD